ncbi:MAG: EamA family transporter [Gaiellaceae bacterium]
MTGILLALSASVAWGFADFGAGVGARRVSVPYVLAVSQVAGLFLVGALVLVLQPRAPTGAQLAWGAFGGALGALGLASFYRALAVGTMGIVGPISATGVVVPVVFGLARGERPSTLQALGVAVACVGVVAASLERIPDRPGRQVGAGVGLALLAAAGFGSSLIGLNRASQAGALWGTLSVRMVAVPVVLAAALVLRPPLRGVRTNLLLLVGAGLGDTGANLLYGLASARGLISVVSVLASLYPVLLVVLARLLLAERIAKPQLAGVATALLGVALISAG